MQSSEANVERKLVVKGEVSSIPIIIVAFGNPLDVARCLRALARLQSNPPHEIFICENAGRNAFDKLIATLTGPQGPCEPVVDGPIVRSPSLERICCLQLRTTDHSLLVSVHVGQAVDNLGYAGEVYSGFGRY